MPDPTVRLFRLLTLFQSRPTWGGNELAERLEVTPRTVRRDVDRLRQLGYPVDAAPGSTGGYRMAPGASLPPLVLDDEEAVAVAVCLRSGAGDGAVAGLAEAALAALDKLERLLPERLRPQVAALNSMTVPLRRGRDDGADEIPPDQLVAIARACRESERLRFAYTDGRGEPSERTVEPYRLVHSGRRWYLAARDVRRDAWRTFRVDRIAAVEAMGHRFTLVDPPDPAELVSVGLSTAPYLYTAMVDLDLPYDDAVSSIPATVATLEPLADDATRLTTGGDDLDAIALHLVRLGCPFTVREPPELIERLHALAAVLTAGDPEQKER